MEKNEQSSRQRNRRDVTPKYDQRVLFSELSYFVEGVSPFGFWNSLSFAVTNEGRDRAVLIYSATNRLASRSRITFRSDGSLRSMSAIFSLSAQPSAKSAP